MTGWLALRRMRRAFRTLPERDRAIFGSVRFDGLGYAEAAERHGCSIDEVQHILARVLATLDREASRPLLRWWRC